MTTLPSRPRRRWVRVLRWVAIALSGVLLLASVGAYLVYRHLDGNISHQDVAPLIGGDRPAKVDSKVRNYLIIGSDTRAGAGDEQFQGTGSEEVSGARSDTTILLHLPAGSAKALLVSIPRDLVTRIPACTRTDGASGVRSAHEAQFNSAFTIGGPACTIKTVEHLTGVRIDDFVEVDFAGFQKMVDALGGVTICNSQPIKDTKDTVDLPAGTVTLDGQTALGYVRARYGIGNGSDLGRIQRQQKFLSAVVRKATSTGLLLNPGRLFRFLDAATSAITTGQLGANDLRSLAQRVKGLDPSKVTFVTMPTEPDPADVNRLVAKQPDADRLWQSLLTDGSVPGGEPAPTAGVTISVAPARVHVRVLDGSGDPARAARAASDLRAAGFDVVGTGTADADSYTSSVVRYGPDRNESSQTLQAAVTGSVRQLDGSLDTTLELVVGSGYSGVTPIRVGATASPGPTVSPSPGTVTPSATPTATPTPTASATPAITADQDACS